MRLCILEYAPSNPHTQKTMNDKIINLTHGDLLQIRMLADALKLYNETGMHLTNPIHINRCFQHWMEKVGCPIGRPSWKKKEALVRHYFEEVLAE